MKPVIEQVWKSLDEKIYLEITSITSLNPKNKIFKIQDEINNIVDSGAWRATWECTLQHFKIKRNLIYKQIEANETII